MRIVKKTLRATITGTILSGLIEKQDWHSSIIHNLNLLSTIGIAKGLKDFMIISGELYLRGSGEVLARALSLTEAKELLHHVHELSCDKDDVS